MTAPTLFATGHGDTGRAEAQDEGGGWGEGRQAIFGVRIRRRVSGAPAVGRHTPKVSRRHRRRSHTTPFRTGGDFGRARGSTLAALHAREAVLLLPEATIYEGEAGKASSPLAAIADGAASHGRRLRRPFSEAETGKMRGKPGTGPSKEGHRWQVALRFS